MPHENEMMSPGMPTDDEDMVTPIKKTKVVGNSGQLDSKRNEEETEMATDEVKQRSTIGSKNNFNTI